MFKMNRKFPLGVIALCAVSLLGLKDTGIFINEHVQPTYSGNKIYFELEEEANIIKTVEDGYIVQKGKAKVTVPKSKILLKNVNVVTYTVTKATALKSGDVLIRNLFVGEDVVLVEDLGQNLKVRSLDNEIGTISKDFVQLKSKGNKPFLTPANMLSVTNANSTDGKKTVKLDKDLSVNIVDYKDSNFIIKLNNILYTVKADKLNLKSGEKVNKEVNLVTEETLKKDEDTLKKLALSANSFDFKDLNGSETGKKAVELALNKIGSPYVWGDVGKEGYDCSGLIYSVYKNTLGINLPRTSSDMSQYGMQVDKNDLRAGDLVFFATTGTSRVSHVGMYIGNGDFVHSSTGKRQVTINNLTEDYYASCYTNATRIVK